MCLRSGATRGTLFIGSRDCFLFSNRQTVSAINHRWQLTDKSVNLVPCSRSMTSWWSPCRLRKQRETHTHLCAHVCLPASSIRCFDRFPRPESLDFFASNVSHGNKNRQITRSRSHETRHACIRKLSQSFLPSKGKLNSSCADQKLRERMRRGKMREIASVFLSLSLNMNWKSALSCPTCVRTAAATAAVGLLVVTEGKESSSVPRRSCTPQLVHRSCPSEALCRRR